MNVSVKPVGSGRRVTDCRRDYGEAVQYVVKIVPSVRALCDIRGVETHFTAAVFRVVSPFVDHALTGPVRQVADRGRPADVITGTVDVSVKMVMGAIDVNAVTKDVRLAIRYVFP